MSQPASYSNTDAPETAAVFTFQSLLDLKYVKPDIKIRDKIPNVDGTLEITDENGVPVGKLDVQVRKIGNGKISHSCPSDLIAYSTKSTLPVLFVGVDVPNKKAYWRHIRRSMPEYKAGQESFTIKFDPAVDAVDPTGLYLIRWSEIVADFQKSLSDYPLLRVEADEKISLKGLSQDTISYFQTMIETINGLLDRDLVVLKKQLFAEVWKFGVGVHEAGPNKIAYQIYAIPYGQGAPLVMSLTGRPISDFWKTEALEFTGKAPLHPHVGKAIQLVQRTRAGAEDPEMVGKEFVWKYISQALQGKLFALHGELLAKEYLWWFLERYHECLGLPAAESYGLHAVNRGLRAYFPGWYGVAFGRYRQRNSRLIPPSRFPTFENIAGMWPREKVSRVEVTDFLKSSHAPFTLPISTQFFSIKSVTEATDYLLEKNVRDISSVYRTPERRGRFIWSGYPANALRHNVQLVLTNALQEYRAFLKGNSLSHLDSQYLSEGTASFYVADLEKWAKSDSLRDAPWMKTYLVQNPKRNLPPVTFLEGDGSAVGLEQVDSSLKFHGESYEILALSSTLVDAFFKSFPLLETVYEMLRDDLAANYGRTARSGAAGSATIPLMIR